MPLAVVWGQVTIPHAGWLLHNITPMHLHDVFLPRSQFRESSSPFRYPPFALYDQCDLKFFVASSSSHAKFRQKSPSGHPSHSIASLSHSFDGNGFPMFVDSFFCIEFLLIAEWRSLKNLNMEGSDVPFL
ncbi:hypothetical protein K443DRAFT_398868 [Laccaria amethystina LaAM-08-1]|uniref:Unplaced genomic scaffold K443scaffold_31, whole genome shotgun sequence n=1 Tax=Laccaria amethystina LaAM-08-1 TaxID=1095629 RepID=A0A0C9XID5_9AGAR|nr:hypothetical protein K443DRAFT_398868 [Laccaria amethystina LaAM-08-1]